jgi:hypothetical protein
MKIQPENILLKLFLWGLLFVSIPIGTSVVPVYAGGPYRGRVIDAETKQPLEGAVVLAVWENKAPGISGTSYSYLDSEEVLTDENGRFVVGKNPPVSSSMPWVAGPRITIFYPGYGFYPRYQVSPKGSTRIHLETMEKQELTFELKRLKTRDERLKVIGGIFPGLEIPRNKIQNLIRLINIESKKLGIPQYDE